jgi:general secretion pathway protein D
MIQADPASNALIITAPEAVFRNLKAVVEQLDVRRAQVLVEALIVEMTANKAAELGIQWLFLDGVEDGDTSFLGGFGTSGVSDNIATVAANPSCSPGAELGVVKARSPHRHRRDANPGSWPGPWRPTPTPTSLPPPCSPGRRGGGDLRGLQHTLHDQPVQHRGHSPFRPWARGRRPDPEVKPQISEGGTVRLRIYRRCPSCARPGPPPAQTDKRSIDSIVLVDDGQIVVLGGLIEDTVADTNGQGAGVGDIPWAACSAMTAAST